MDSRSVGNTLSPPKVTCLRKLEKLHSETHNSSTIFENAQYGTEEKQKGKILTAFLARSEKSQKCLLSQVLFNNGNQLNKAKEEEKKNC